MFFFWGGGGGVDNYRGLKEELFDFLSMWDNTIKLHEIGRSLN